MAPIHAAVADDALPQLEAIARLAWSDDAARMQLGALGALPAIVRCMQEVGDLPSKCM